MVTSLEIIQPLVIVMKSTNQDIEADLIQEICSTVDKPKSRRTKSSRIDENVEIRLWDFWPSYSEKKKYFECA